MKMIIAIVFCLLITYCSQAQGIFNQKGEMIKKCIEQIALLGTYIRQAKQGYNIIDKGLKTVKNIKNGEFDLHDLYYTSLKTINPSVKGFSKIEAAIETGSGISTIGSKTIYLINGSEWLSPGEKSYLRKLMTKLLDETDKDLENLANLVTSGKIELTDDERVRRIDEVYRELHNKSSFVQKFSSTIKMLIANRSSDIRSSGQVQQFYNQKD